MDVFYYSDLAANIQRCKDRIEDNIMPQLWEWKLKRLEEDYAKVQAMIRSEPAGLSDEVITRLKSLEIIHKQTVKNGDEYDQIKNIEAIMSSYRQAKLTWRNGKVTYWADGNCISKDYEEFDEKRFGNLSDEYVKKRRTQQDPYPKAGIWVEGVSPSDKSSTTCSSRCHLLAIRCY